MVTISISSTSKPSSWSRSSRARIGDDVADLRRLLGRQLVPQLLVPVVDREGDLDRIDVVGETTGRLEVEQAAGDVVGRDHQVELALPGRQLLVPFGGLDVDDVRLERTCVAAEQGVRQRAVAPVEPGQVDPDQQHDERVEHPVAEIGDLEPATHQQRAIRQRVVEVAGDDDALADGSLGDDGDHLGGRETVFGDLPQESVLAIGEVVGQLLDDVRDALEFDQLHDVTVQAEHAVEVGHLPVLEPPVERQLGQGGVFGRPGHLDSHPPSVASIHFALKHRRTRDDEDVWESPR